MLPITIHCISEVDMAVSWVYGDVIDRVELPSKVVVHKDC
jgi:hypothetical protein